MDRPGRRHQRPGFAGDAEIIEAAVTKQGAEDSHLRRLRFAATVTTSAVSDRELLIVGRVP